MDDAIYIVLFLAGLGFIAVGLVLLADILRSAAEHIEEKKNAKKYDEDS